MILKPITTEKAIKLVDLDNTLVFEIDRRAKKTEIKEEVEKVFSVKVEGVRTHIRHNKKYAYIKLNKTNKAIDVATKLGVI